MAYLQIAKNINNRKRIHTILCESHYKYLLSLGPDRQASPNSIMNSYNERDTNTNDHQYLALYIKGLLMNDDVNPFIPPKPSNRPSLPEGKISPMKKYNFEFKKKTVAKCVFFSKSSRCLIDILANFGQRAKRLKKQF